MARELKFGKMQRSMPLKLRQIEPTEENGRTLYECVASTEEPCVQWYPGIGMVNEILGHSDGECDLTRAGRGLAVLDDHEAQIGYAPRCWLDTEARCTRAQMRFFRTEEGQEYEQTVKDGDRPFISVGYWVTRTKLLSPAPLDEAGNAIGLPTYRAEWEWLELSNVPVPADIKAGMGRSAADEARPVTVDEPEPETPKEEEKHMEIEVVKEAPPPADANAAAMRAVQLMELANLRGVSDQVGQMLRDGKAHSDVADWIIRNGKTAPIPQPGSEGLDDAAKHAGKHDYSVVRALRGHIAEREGTGRFDGVEAEFHQESVKSMPMGYSDRGGVRIPLRLRETPARMQRAMTTSTATGGTEWVFEQPGEFIDYLWPMTVAGRLGADTMAGLTGPVAFPKLAGGPTFYWMSENPTSGVSASYLTTGVVNLSPKTLMGTVPYPRQLLTQALPNVDVEAKVKGALARGLALAIDKACVNGASTAGEPAGVYTAQDVLTKDITAQTHTLLTVPTYANLVDAMGQVAAYNVDLTYGGWACRPDMAAALKRSLTAAASGGVAAVSTWIWDGDFNEGRIAGYKAASSSNLSATVTGNITGTYAGTEQSLCFGAWDTMKIGVFGNAIELLVDSTSAAIATKGLIQITAFAMADVALTHGQAFVKFTGASCGAGLS